jgi:hypothetical protein
VSTDPHWLQQFYKGWSTDELESRLINLSLAANGRTEMLQLQAEMERREREKADE